MTASFTSKQRLTAAFDLQTPDRPPILGGWLSAPEYIRILTGCSEEEYWQDPARWSMEADRALGSDGIVNLFTPASREEYRIIDSHTVDARADYTMERILADLEALPDPEEVRENFDFEQAYVQFKEQHLAMQERCGEMLWCPADWGMIPIALRYHEFGYENALTLPLLYPDLHLKMMRVKAEEGRHTAMLRARAIKEGIHPKAILTGEDLCSQEGPMISPRFLRKDYFPLLEYAMEPLLEAGTNLVWHCDGNVRPILADVLACGFAGLQGFQRECSMELEWIVDLKTRQGDPLLIFGDMSVTTTLPYGTPAEVRAAVARSMEICRGKASLVFFTSNTILPDTPLENIRTFWDAVRNSRW